MTKLNKKQLIGTEKNGIFYEVFKNTLYVTLIFQKMTVKFCRCHVTISNWYLYHYIDNRVETEDWGGDHWNQRTRHCTSTGKYSVNICSAPLYWMIIIQSWLCSGFKENIVYMRMYLHAKCSNISEMHINKELKVWKFFSQVSRLNLNT